MWGTKGRESQRGEKDGGAQGGYAWQLANAKLDFAEAD